MISTITVLSRVSRYFENFGVTTVMDKLSELGDAEIVTRDKELEDYLIQEICNHFLVDKRLMITNAKVTGDAMEARDMCFIMLKKHLDYSHEKISSIFKKRPQQITYALNRYSRMSPKIKHEKDFLDAFSVIDKAIAVYKAHKKQTT